MIKKMPATLSTPCDIIGQKSGIFLSFFRLASELAMSKKSSKIKGFRDRKKYFCEYLTHSDDLGRIVVPKEIRRTLRIREGDALEIFTDREGEIILKKYSPLGEMGNFADQYAESLAQTLGYLVCITDTDQVIAAAGPGKKEFQEQLITRQLAEVIARREQFLASSMDRKFTVIVSGQNAELKWQVVSPIICAGDAIGSVVILAKDGRKKPGELEQKMILCAAGFLGRQMEQ
mgnify:CR=1 FL=1